MLFFSWNRGWSFIKKCLSSCLRTKYMLSKVRFHAAWNWEASVGLCERGALILILTRTGVGRRINLPSSCHFISEEEYYLKNIYKKRVILSCLHQADLKEIEGQYCTLIILYCQTIKWFMSRYRRGAFTFSSQQKPLALGLSKLNLKGLILQGAALAL